MKNSEPLQLQRISVFMPQRLRDDEIERLFIMRQDVFHTLLDSIKSEKAASIPQHHLIIGQRGMGKTTLLKRLDVELRKQPLNKKFVPFTFPEEQYNIDRLSKFWLNCLDALADTLQTEGDEKMAFHLDQQIATLSSIRNEQELSQKAYELLRDTTKSLGRRPVFLLDNLNLIFDRLGEVEQSKLRKLITEPGAPIFIGASPEAFDKDLQYDAPFYDAFAVHFLYKLDFQQTLTMLRHLGEITNQTILLSQLNAENMPRLETLHALTGGNVRTVVILFSLVAQGFSADIFQDLEALIDQMTPLYKSRFEELSPQAQVVVDSVALNWDPCKLETIRERTSLENNQVSVQLDRLAKAGWISKLGKRKAAYYEISERFFNVWYLMRRSSRRQRRDLLWLTRFLQAWFSRQELVQQAKVFMRNVHEREKQYELAYGLALARALPNQTGEQLKEKIYQRLLQLVDGDVVKLEELVGVNMEEVSDEIIEKYNVDESKRLWIQGVLTENPEEAKIIYEKAIEASPKNKHAWHSLGSVLEDLAYESGLNFEIAENAYKQAINIDPAYDSAWSSLANIWETFRPDLGDAEEAYRKVIKLRPTYYGSWADLGGFMFRKKAYSEAKHCFLTSLSFFSKNSDVLLQMAELEDHFGDITLAEKYYLDAIESSKSDYYPRVKYGWFLQEQGRVSEAEQVIKKATNLKKSDAMAFWVLGNLFITEGRWEEAEQAYSKGLQIEDKNYWCNEGLAELYRDKLHHYNKARIAYENAIESALDDFNIKISYIYLLRDKLKLINESKLIFDELKKRKPLAVEVLLHEATFAEIEKEFDYATECWKRAISLYGDLPEHQGHFYRSMGLTVQYGFDREMLKIFKNEGHDRIFRPFYEAIKALTLNSEEYLKNEVAAEVREIALQIFKFMQNYNAPVNLEVTNG
ncbi:ATP-binding protein [Spirosoma fluviale]|uniref:Tfp pilus assembly protein PilF n=1 Tax=Spirosoma fluviale TaxID=1597977 RepID=A0A286GTJ4_9BACT|nr:ATP-binding protein [Spirosoma fluviale]SOD98409.1 Tfp pilus assembly protein PilF [Spirosoma fluviale]